MSDLKLRLISAVILGPAVLLIAYLGGIPYLCLIILAALLFQHEWFSITGTVDKSVPAIVGYGGLAASAVTYYVGLPLVALGLVGVGVVGVYATGGMSKSARWGAEGVLYSGLALLALLGARLADTGLVFIFYLLIVVWATDIFAYFAGRAFGGPKLWRRVSPNKTWSGAIGGLCSAVALGTGFVAATGQQYLLVWAALAVFLSVLSQAGDLLESAIKRRFDVKDSSNLIPGHGGIMDRIDGLVSAAIAAAVLGLMLGGTLTDPMSGFGLG
ncbi:phosphatidate cytidylyltransferase [Roseibium sp.]|uniref:phosphatidate cytidylyltransferase n=1 Tax=Roseibium sp. TaxID=1936156 RepID=UPI003A977506